MSKLFEELKAEAIKLATPKFCGNHLGNSWYCIAATPDLKFKILARLVADEDAEDPGYHYGLQVEAELSSFRLALILSMASKSQSVLMGKAGNGLRKL